MSSLDPELARLLPEASPTGAFDSSGAGVASRRPRGDDLAQERGQRGPPEPVVVHVSVQFTGAMEDLLALGFEPVVVTAHPRGEGTLASGQVPLAALRAMADLDHVVYVEAPRYPQLELEESVPEIRADVVHRPPTSLTGAGVVVGVIDSGFDLTHPGLRKADGTTRVLAYWNQHGWTPPPALNNVPLGAVPEPYKFGWALSQDDINTALGATPPPAWLFVDATAEPGETAAERKRRVAKLARGFRHGTHVTGIAAGNGRGRTGLVGNDFTGVAPGADLILVQLDEAALGDPLRLTPFNYAHDYIWRHESAADRPIVINHSMGENWGPHDGTTVEELMLEAALLTPPGRPARAFVKSAGNEGSADYPHHAQVAVPAGAPTQVSFVVAAPEPTTRLGLDLWFPGTSVLQAELVVRDPFAPATSPPVSGTSSAPAWGFPTAAAPAARTSVTLDAIAHDPRNQDGRIVVRLTPGSSKVLPRGEYALRLTALSGAPIAVDCWMSSDNPQAVFTSHASRACTVTAPGTARGVVTVASYAKPSFFGVFGGSVADTSSRGPVRGSTGTPNLKPDISAPGQGIVSAKADIGQDAAGLLGETRGELLAVCVDEYYSCDGTSMAAPHVAGVIALMMQREPTLAPGDIVQRLHATARRPDGKTGPSAFDTDYGFGKVDAAAAVAPSVPSPQPAPTGPQPPSAGSRPSPTRIPAGGTGTPAETPRRERPSAPTGWAPGLADLLARVPAAAPLAALVSVHAGEVLRLLRTQPRVAAHWRRLHGQALARVVRDVATSGVPVTLPEAGAATSQPDLELARRRLAAFLDCLPPYASPLLREDLLRHRNDLLGLVSDDVVRALGARSGAR